MKEHLSVYLKQQIEAGLPGREAHFEMSHKLITYTPDTPSAAM